MRTFTDAKGHQWRLDVTAGVLMDIQTEMGLNLLDNPEEIPEGFKQLVGILWITCSEEAKQMGVSPQEFAHRLGGKVLQEAVDRWMKEWADFFGHLSPARGQVIAGMWDKAKEIDSAKAEVIGKAFSSTSTDWLALLGKIRED